MRKIYKVLSVTCLAVAFLASLSWIALSNVVLTDKDHGAWAIYQEEARKETEVFRLFSELDGLAIARFKHPNEITRPGRRLSELQAQSVDWWASQKLSDPDNHRLSEIDWLFHNAAWRMTQACSELASTRHCGGNEDCIRARSEYAVGFVRWARFDYYRALFLMESALDFYDGLSFLPFLNLSL